MSQTLTPLRYPGGKDQLHKFVAKLIELNGIKNGTYIEPFSGGSGVSIRLLLNNSVENIIINDFDPSIYAFWYSILNYTDRFIKKIESIPVTIEEWTNQKKLYDEHHDEPLSFENGFATFFLNRTNRSGIIKGGPLGKHDQTGSNKIDCRFTKKTSINKINNIAQQKDRITLYNMDGADLITQVIKKLDSKNTFCFFDPPYYRQGQSLYTNFFTHDDHQKLHNAIVQLEDYYWITTYDNHPEIAKMYSDVNSYQYQLSYSAQTKRKENELLFTNSHTTIKSFDKVVLKTSLKNSQILTEPAKQTTMLGHFNANNFLAVSPLK